MKEYSTEEFATATGGSKRTIEGWRIERTYHGKKYPPKLSPARYDGRKAIYTEEQIPIAKALLGRKADLGMDSLYGENALDVDFVPASSTEQTAPMNATQEKNFSQDTCGDSSGEYTADETPQNFQSTNRQPARNEINDIEVKQDAQIANDDSAEKTAPKQAPQRFSQKTPFDPDPFFDEFNIGRNKGGITDITIENITPEKVAPDVPADSVPQVPNEQSEVGGVYFNATGAEKNNAVVDELNHCADVDSPLVDDTSTALTIAQNKLPTRIEDVAKFVLIGRDKLRAVHAEISAINKIEVAAEVREQKLAEGQQIGELVLLAEARLGELLNQMPKATTNHKRQKLEIPSAGKFLNDESESVEIPSAKKQSGMKKPSKLEAAAELGFGKNQVSQFQKLADNPAAVQKAIADAKTRGEIVTRSRALSMIKKAERKQDIQRQVDEIERQEFEKPDGLFDVIVVDPPWNYGTAYNSDGRRCANPYPEMAQEELKAIKLPAAEDCVLFLWTTHKFIWNAKELLDQWGFDYRCMLVWNKMKMGTGDLFRLQCEFCLVGLKGKPIFKDVHSIRDLIEKPSREHSRKPDAFYRLVDKLCTGRKLDYFSRQKREGWTAYGNNTEKFRIDLPNQTGGGDKKIMP